MELEKLLEKYKVCSLEIMSILEKEDYEGLDIKMDERQHILDAVNELTFTKEEITKVVDKLEIIELSAKINDLMALKRNYLKSEIDDTVVKRNANSEYYRNSHNNYRIFSRKV